MVPSSIKEFVKRGHKVLVETQAGEGIGFSDAHYKEAGAEIRKTAAEVWNNANMIIKVKEPLKEEFGFLREDLVLYTYLHLAAEPALTKALIESKCTAIAYETVTDAAGRLPLLAPMSEVAGRMSVQVGAYFLEKAKGGAGVLLGGVPGVLPGNVVIIGGGIAGTNAAQMAVGMGANVTILDRSVDRLRWLNSVFGASVTTCFSTTSMIEDCVKTADLVVGAVLVAGASAPKLITREMLKTMRKGSVMVDIAIDQGGCFETSKPTSHQNPTFEEEGIIHYCVTNMPGAVARTSTFALNNVTLSYAIAMADNGAHTAALADQHLLNGVNIMQGHVVHHAVAESLSLPYTDPKSLFV
jgi:alanine dehydrogenase